VIHGQLRVMHRPWVICSTGSIVSLHSFPQTLSGPTLVTGELL
jgi:hypothetical protein